MKNELEKGLLKSEIIAAIIGVLFVAFLFSTAFWLNNKFNFQKNTTTAATEERK